MKPTSTRYGVLVWLCGVTAIAYIHRSCLAIPSPEIRRDLGLSVAQMGAIMGSFSAVYALSQIPAGWLGDRWGSRRTLPLYAIAWSLATGSIGMATGMVSIMLSQMANGLAQAGVFPCSARTMSNWFPVSRRGLPIGLTGCFQSLGLIAANLLTASLLVIIGWRMIFPLVSILGFAWAVGFFVWFRDRPAEHAGVNEAELSIIHEGASAGNANDSSHPDRDGGPPPTPWRQILTSPTMGLICGQQFFRAAGYAFYQTWFPTCRGRSRARAR